MLKELNAIACRYAGLARANPTSGFSAAEAGRETVLETVPADPSSTLPGVDPSEPVGARVQAHGQIAA